MMIMMRRFVMASGAVAVLLPAGGAWGQVMNWRSIAIYDSRCANCHEGVDADPRAPSREALQAFTTERVLESLTTGAMVPNTTGLSDAQKRGLAAYLTGRPLGSRADRSADAMPNRCTSAMPMGDPTSGPRWNGWSPDLGTNARFQPGELAGLTARQVPRLRLKWAFAFPDGIATRSQPTVVGGRVFVGSDNGMVYSLDASTGCVYWSFEARTAASTAVSIGALPGSAARYAAYFGDFRANVYAVDAETGDLLWQTPPLDSHWAAKITGSPALDLQGGRLFVPVSSWEEVSGPNQSYECCTSQGSVVALDTRTGELLWKTYAIPERPRPIRKNSAGTQLYGPAGAGVWVTPTLDYKRGALYVGTANGYIAVPDSESNDAIIAFDLDTGRRLWSTQLLANDFNKGGCGTTAAELRINCPGFTAGPNDDISGSPILHTLPNGREILIAGQESGRITALDPDGDGAVLWVAQAGDDLGPGGAGMGPAADGELYYRPVALQDQTGGMAALRPATGERVWYTTLPKPTGCSDPQASWCSSGHFGAATVIPGVVFAGAQDGTLRAYSTGDGKVLWEYNTKQEFEAVNGVRNTGGSMGGHGPTVVGGMVFVGSGYNVMSGAPGNVLLAFGLD
jgi:polyvinyl alcohol dehydrogenase (cytochrome)